MNRTTRLSLAFALCLSFVMLSTIFVVAAPAAGDKEEGFTSLFNGKDTSGWIYGGKKSGNGYQVADGVL